MSNSSVNMRTDSLDDLGDPPKGRQIKSGQTAEDIRDKKGGNLCSLLSRWFAVELIYAFSFKRCKTCVQKIGGFHSLHTIQVSLLPNRHGRMCLLLKPWLTLGRTC